MRKITIFHFLKIFAPLEAKMMKHDKHMIKKCQNEKTRGKVQFSIFWFFLHHWKQQWWNMIKKWKMLKNWKNWRKIAIFHFLQNFCTTGRKKDEKWKTWSKKWKKNSRNIAIFHFFAEFLHHWKQKWWKMKKHDKINDECNDNQNV